MPIETICQGCARKLRVPDEHAGRKARCPQCGMIYVVPGAPVPRAPSHEHQPQHLEQTAYSPQRLHRDAPDRWKLQTPDGRVYGPVPRAELDQWFREGRVPAGAQILWEADQVWRSAVEIYPTLGGRRRGLSEAHNPFVDRGTHPGSPFSRSNAMQVYQPHRGGLILTMGILGWALCFVFGPIAWSMGQADLRAMRAGQMDPAGMSLTQTGMILGIIQTILLLLGIAAVCTGVLG